MNCIVPLCQGRHRRAALGLPLALALACGPVLAQSLAAPAPAPARAAVSGLSEAASRIEGLLAAGQGDQAIAAARELMRTVTLRAGFGVSNARLTVAPAEGFGMFQPRPDARYRPGEPVYAYVEVHGFTLSPLPDGANRLLFDVSFTLESPDGRQMTDALVPMGEVRLDSFSQPLDGYFHLTYSITGAEGAFVLRTLVTDRVSGQTAEFRLPVEFVTDRAK